MVTVTLGHMSPHPHKEVDADEVSLTSTVEDEAAEDAVYEVEEILAEKWDIWNDEPEQRPFRGVKYLTKWDGYPLHECKRCPNSHHMWAEACRELIYYTIRCTWEPKEAFAVAGTDGNDLPGIPPILQTWYDCKKSMGESQFRSHCRKNIKDFYAAIEKAEKAKAIRKAKRAKLRQKLAKSKKRPRPVLLDSDDEDKSVTPGKSQDRTSSQNAVCGNDLDPRNSSSVKHPSAARKPPLEQSDSSTSEEEEPALPMLASNETSNNMTCDPSSAKYPPSGSQSRRNSAQPPSSLPRYATPTVTPKPVAKSNQLKTTHRKESQMPSRSLKDTVSQNEKPAIRAPVKDENQKLDQSAVPPLPPTQRKACTAGELTKDLTSGASSASTERPANSTDQASTKRPSHNVGIKVVNQPKVPLRSEWKNSNRQFSTLHFRGLAQKRSHKEGTPDMTALEIVNDVFSTVKPNPQTPYDNPYGRREAGRDRAKQSPENDDLNRAGISGSSANEKIPLAPWEVDKVPQVCASWRLSNNCPKPAQSCSFLHRNKDPNGVDYPVGHIDGWIPPKYRKPPVTCTHWLYKRSGCYKPDEQCLYAHENTGWIQNEKNTGEKVVRIDQNTSPQHEKADNPLAQAPIAPRSQKTPSRCQLTCWYWAQDRCRNSAETCPFQHYDTGFVARPPTSRDKHRMIDRETHHDPIAMINTLKECPLSNTEDAVNSETSNIAEHTTKLSPPPPPPPPAEPHLSDATCENVRKQISSTCKLNFEELFASHDAKGRPGLLDRQAFLVYHLEEHSEELELVTRWLLMHHVQIFCVHYAGAWEEFQNQIKGGGSGIIMIHPDFKCFTELPGLGDMLRRPIRLWSVGLQDGIEYGPGLSEASYICRYDAIEIFPVGGFIYITDEVVEAEPRLTLKIVESFFDKIVRLKQRLGPSCPGREVEDTSLLWRLCVRPEFMEYLIQSCEQHARELEAGDADMQSRARLYALLAETGYIEQDDPTEPLSAVLDKYPILSERRVLAENEPISYFETRARSREAANWSMVRYYAALQVEMRRDYRHFFVVHTEPQAGYVQQWRQQIQTIGDVLTPLQCVDELRKDSKDSLFDFCERFMLEKEK